jgi:hypothetical protein
VLPVGGPLNGCAPQGRAGTLGEAGRIIEPGCAGYPFCQSLKILSLPQVGQFEQPVQRGTEVRAVVASWLSE